MQIAEITVSYEATQSLSNYSNVRPGLRLTARLDDGENVEEAKRELLDRARATVQSEIDAALIADNQPPRYYAGPRYRVEYNRETSQVAILPDTLAASEALARMGKWLSHSVVPPSSQMSPDQAQAVAVRLAVYLSSGEKVYHVMDCSDGNLGRLAVQPVQQQQADEAIRALDPDDDEDDEDKLF